MSKEINNLNNGLNNIYATKNELEELQTAVGETFGYIGNNVIGPMQNDIDNLEIDINNVNGKMGDPSNLQTNNKINLVDAINELFQSANSGKQLIADAIGNPLITGNSTFNAMSEAILGYENNLKIILTNKGVEVTEEDNMTSLINKVSSLNNGVGISKDKTTPLKAIIHFNTSSVTFNTVGEHTVVDLNLTRFKNVTDKMYVTMIVTGGSYGVVAGIKDYTDNTIIHQQSMGNGYGGDSTINYAMVCDTSHDIRIFTKVTSVIFTAKRVEVYYYLEV